MNFFENLELLFIDKVINFKNVAKKLMKISTFEQQSGCASTHECRRRLNGRTTNVGNVATPEIPLSVAFSFLGCKSKGKVHRNIVFEPFSVFLVKINPPSPQNNHIIVISE